MPRWLALTLMSPVLIAMAVLVLIYVVIFLGFIAPIEYVWERAFSEHPPTMREKWGEFLP